MSEEVLPLYQLGEIYVITSPSNMVYIGQCACILQNGKAYGTRARWTGHLTDSRRANGGTCRRLNLAIRTYGENAFAVDTLMTVPTTKLDYYEELLIRCCNSTNPEKGYNIRTGGKHTRLTMETREKMRESRMKYVLPSPTEETKQKISQTLIDKVMRKGHDGRDLPKYVKYISWVDRRGYAIVSHPVCKIKYFVSKSKSLETLLEHCIRYLASV